MPGILVIPVSFYLDNTTGGTVPFTSSSSCGTNPLDTQSGTLSPNQSLFDGGFFSGCLVGSGSGDGTVTIDVGSGAGECSFTIQVNGLAQFSAVGNGCTVMDIQNDQRDKGGLYTHLIYNVQVQAKSL